MNPEGRVAVITGASSGIGRATALTLARAGAKVVLAARRADLLASLADECRELGADALAIETDVTDRDACFALIARSAELGPVEILVNNAGFAIFDHLTEARPDDVRSMMETNYLGAYWCTQAALPGMLERGRGSIVTIGSITGVMGFAGMTGYSATKFALSGFMESLRAEVIDRGIEVSLVCPGTTRTDFFTIAQKGKMPAASRLLLAIPPERVARTVLRAIRTGRARIIVPVGAALYMRLKELTPGIAHFIMRRVSNMLVRRKD